jgi:outer membrane protein OmpA-like peptidoglycan-associated protein
LEKIIINKPIVLENIYYDLDKWNIRPDAAVELDKLITILNDNPKIVIELGSHTDSRAPDSYNMSLSDRRAKSAADYIVKKGGIDSSRITGKGYGETMLVNSCKNKVRCTEADHQKNRRTEFKVVSQ